MVGDRGLGPQAGQVGERVAGEEALVEDPGDEIVRSSTVVSSIAIAAPSLTNVVTRSVSRS